MEDDPIELPDDPAMRAALRRALGEETAPPALRRRVEAMLVTPAVVAAAGKAASAPARASLKWPTWMGAPSYKTLAAASIALLAMGVMIYQAVQFIDYRHGQPSAPHVDFPLSVAQDMVKAHDRFLKEPHPAPTADAATLAHKLTQTEGFTVATLNNAAGWELKAAEESAIGSSKGALLQYRNQNEVVSVISMRGPDHCNGANSDVYRGTIDGHALSGYVQAGVVYAVVASSPSSTADLDSLVSQVKSCTSGSSCSTGPGTAVPATTPASAP